jgi:hypothetical protein
VNPTTRANRGGRAAFTLLEVMLALGLGIALLSAVSSLSWRVAQARVETREWIESHDGVQRVIGALERDLTTCVAGEAALGAGIRGDARSIRVISRGVTAGVDDFTVTEFRFDRGRIAGRRDGASDDERWSEVARGVESMRLRYLDGREWKDEFDSAASGRLPGAVMIEVRFGSANAAATSSAISSGSSSGEAAGSTGSVSAAASIAPTRGPDRVRVIAIPDAAEPQGGAG